MSVEAPVDVADRERRSGSAGPVGIDRAGRGIVGAAVLEVVREVVALRARQLLEVGVLPGGDQRLRVQLEA